MKKEEPKCKKSLFRIFLIISILFIAILAISDIKILPISAKKPEILIKSMGEYQPIKIGEVEPELQNGQAVKTEENNYNQESEGLDLELKQANQRIIYLEKRIMQYKNNNIKKQLRIVYLLMDIQDKINNEETFKTELENLKTLTNQDKFFNEKIDTLIPYSTKNNPNEKKIYIIFQNDMNNALKKSYITENASIKNKIKNLSHKIVTVRKTDDKYSNFEEGSIDLWLLQIQKAMDNKNYDQALKEIKGNANYREYLAKTENSLEDFIIINKTIKYLIEYNKKLTL